MLEAIEFVSLSDCLHRVVAQKSRAGTKNSIIIGLANGMIDMSHPVMSWVLLLLDQRMGELAEVPLEDGRRVDLQTLS